MIICYYLSLRFLSVRKKMRLIFNYFENGVKYLLIIFLLNATISQAERMKIQIYITEKFKPGI